MSIAIVKITRLYIHFDPVIISAPSKMSLFSLLQPYTKCKIETWKKVKWPPSALFSFASNWTKNCIQSHERFFLFFFFLFCKAISTILQQQIYKITKMKRKKNIFCIFLQIAFAHFSVLLAGCFFLRVMHEIALIHVRFHCFFFFLRSFR